MMGADNEFGFEQFDIFLDLVEHVGIMGVCLGHRQENNVRLTYFLALLWRQDMGEVGKMRQAHAVHGIVPGNVEIAVKLVYDSASEVKIREWSIARMCRRPVLEQPARHAGVVGVRFGDKHQVGAKRLSVHGFRKHRPQPPINFV